MIPDPYACGAHVDEVAKEIRDSFTGFTRVHAERLDAGLSDVPVIPTLDRAVGSNPALDAAS